MTRRALLLLAACSTPATSPPPVECGTGTRLEGDICVNDVVPPVECDPGTHLVGDTCIPNGRARYQLLVQPKLGAEAKRNKIVVIGTHPDGTPALEPVVLNTNRAGVGTFVAPLVTPGPLGASTYFTPCDAALPGCLGPLSFTVALASAPTAVIATTPVELVEPIEVNPAKRCLSGGNVLHLEGDDMIFTGSATYTDATWAFDPLYPDWFRATVTPAGASSAWRIEFDTRYFAWLVPHTFEDVRQARPQPERDHALMDVSGFGNQCDSITGRFDVIDYQRDGITNAVTKATFAFEQFCNGSLSSKVTGCLHYEP